ncbi:hypothetical protein D3C78_1274980 [compost metagenome]
MLFFGPEQFRHRVARRDDHAEAFQRAFFTAQMSEQTLVFGAGFGVAPELGRAQHFTLIIEQDQTVLLAGDADAEDRLTVDIRRQQCLAGSDGEGVQPLLGVLFAATVGAADHRVGGGALAEDLTADGVEDDGFGALGAAVDA